MVDGERGVAGQAVRCVGNMDGGQTLVAAGDSERGNRRGLAEWARARLRTNVTAMKRTNGYAKRMQSRLRCSRCGSDQCTDGSSAQPASQPASVRQCCSSQWDGWQPEFVGMMWTEDRAQFMRRAQARRRAVCDSGRASSARPKGAKGRESSRESVDLSVGIEDGSATCFLTAEQATLDEWRWSGRAANGAAPMPKMS